MYKNILEKIFGVILTMNFKFRNITKSVVFLIILVVIFFLCERILTEKWMYRPGINEGETNRYESFYQLPSGTVDYIVLGTSHSFFSINPMLIYAREGYTGYDLGSPAQTVEMSYWWLQEAFKYQKMEYVFYDVGSLFFNEEDKDAGSVIKGLTYMKPGIQKLKAAYDCKLLKMSVLELISPMYVFHSRWKVLTEDYFNIGEHYYPYKGTYLTFSTKLNTDKELANKRDYILYEEGMVTLQNRGISEQNKKIFHDMYLFCQERGIKLVPMKCPTLYWDENNVEIINNLLSEYDLTLLDLNEEININWKLDTPDNGKHTNFWGNCKSSDGLAKWMRNNYELVDHRDDTGYNLWKEDLQKYFEFEEERLKTYREKLLTYLQILAKNQSDLCIIFSGRDDICASWDSELQYYVERLGLTSDFYHNIQNSYIGIIDGGTVKIDNFAEYPMVADICINLENGEVQHLEVKSGGFLFEDVSEIFVGDKNYSMNSRGINIVVIDKSTGKVVSSASADTWSSNLTFKETIWNNELWEECKERGEQELEGGIYTICPASNANYALDIPNGGEENGLALQLWDVSSDLPQQFEIVYCGNGLYMLRAVCSGKYLSVENFGDTCGTSIIQEDYTGLSNQKWYIYENGENEYTIMSHYNQLVFDVTGREAFSGLQMQMYENYSEQWQKFLFKKLNG